MFPEAAVVKDISSFFYMGQYDVRTVPKSYIIYERYAFSCAFLFIPFKAFELAADIDSEYDSVVGNVKERSKNKSSLRKKRMR